MINAIIFISVASAILTAQIVLIELCWLFVTLSPQGHHTMDIILKPTA